MVGVGILPLTFHFRDPEGNDDGKALNRNAGRWLGTEMPDTVFPGRGWIRLGELVQFNVEELFLPNPDQ